MTHSRKRRSFERPNRRDQERALAEDFVCRHCGMHVSCDVALSGVQNRNHCPFCLWSRHLDAQVAGDRRSACRAVMEPVGLTLKRSRNKYASAPDGELMLIHRCTVCGKLVINRIAADDDSRLLMQLCDPPGGDGALGAELQAMGVTMLTARDRDLVRRRLLGSSSPDAPAE